MQIILHFFVCLSEERVPFHLYVLNRLVFITEVEIVYCAVRAESLYMCIVASMCTVDRVSCLVCNCC